MSNSIEELVVFEERNKQTQDTLVQVEIRLSIMSSKVRLLGKLQKWEVSFPDLKRLQRDQWCQELISEKNILEKEVFCFKFELLR